MASVDSPAKFCISASQVISESTYAAFVAGAVEENIKSVPGVGAANQALLAAASVTTTHRTSKAAHAEAFYQWLASIKITSGRAVIVRAVAEKVDTMIPGTFSVDACPQ